MSASTQFEEAPMSLRSKTARLERSDRSMEKSDSELPQTAKSARAQRAKSGTPDEAAATSRATSAASTRRSNYKTDAQQARGKIARLDKKLKRLEPPARSSESSSPHERGDHAEEQHERLDSHRDHDTVAQDHGERTRIMRTLHAPQRAGDLERRSREKSPTKHPPRRAKSSSSPARTGKLWCGNNKLDRKLRINGGDLEIGSPHACFTRGIGGAIHQDIPPEEEEAFLEKWTQPYDKLVTQPIWYRNSEPPHGMIKCTLPQALARGWAVGCKKRAQMILDQRGHTERNARLEAS